MDQMQATRRKYPMVGGLADLLAAGTSPQRTQQMRGLMEFLQVPDIAQTLNRVSYGEPLTTGAGMTTKLRPEAESTLMAALGMLPAGRPAEAGAMALGRAGERMAERVVPQVMERGGLPAEMLGAMAQGTQSPATVFHGTPHLFNKFDASKIGTGEGAQVYGHGLYLAESPDVAKQYKETLAHKAYSKLEQVDRNNYRVTAPDGTVITEGVPLGPATRAKGAFDAQAGNLMQVDLPDEQIAKMLDFDKPLSEQSEFVRKAIQENELDYVPDRFTGGRLLEELHKGFAPDVAAKHLREAGIPGIRYLDQNSRAVPNITNKRLADLYAKHGGNADAAVDEMMRSVYNTPKKKDEMREQFMKQLQAAPKKTSNFVVFPGMEDMLRIEQINNQPVESLFRSLGR
jgi:hypothetical protein